MAGAWVVGLGLGLTAARFTRIGPVAFGLTGRHGVHVGDLAAMALGCLGATVVTRRVLR